MTNKDKLALQKQQFAEKFRMALDQKDDKAIVQAFDEYSDGVIQTLRDTALEMSNKTDAAILASRGIRQLTEVEQKFYDGLIEAFKADDPKMALANADKTIPVSVITTVMEDVKKEHKLLNVIDFQNTHGAVKWIFSDGSAQLATWDKITSAIIEEVSGSIQDVDFATCKLSAFIPVPKDLLELGASYLDAYVRNILSEAIANGMEYGIVKGNGNKQPIGMCKDLIGNVIEGVYPDKTKVSLKSFKPVDYCPVVGELAKKPNGDYRKVNSVIFICNPKDYLTKVTPSTTVMAADGTYKNNRFPFPTDPIQTAMLAEGEAIIGLPKEYLALISGGKSGNIEYSDQYQFLEDNRVYLSKVYGYGRPKDNNCFVFLNISDLEVLDFMVVLKELSEE